ncbi:hypothetical protein U5N28_14455 [Lysinibacillus telephonicus]|nr:hypothetical protein [Lysinibacillus telephonicus]
MCWASIMILLFLRLAFMGDIVTWIGIETNEREEIEKQLLHKLFV